MRDEKPIHYGREGQRIRITTGDFHPDYQAGHHGEGSRPATPPQGGSGTAPHGSGGKPTPPSTPKK